MDRLQIEMGTRRIWSTERILVMSSSLNKLYFAGGVTKLHVPSEQIWLPGKIFI